VRLPLRVFLFVSISVATLAPIAYLGSTQIARWREVQRAAADKDLRFAAESLAEAIGQALDANVRELGTMAKHIGTYRSLDPAILQSVLHEFRLAFASFLGLNVAGLDGMSTVIDPTGRPHVHLSDRLYFQEMERTGRTTVSGVELGRISWVPTIHICAPIWTDANGQKSERIGAVVGALGLGHLQELTAKSVAVFGDMQARVLDKNLRLAVDSASHGEPPLADLSANELYASVPSSGETLLRTGRNDRGEPIRAALARIPEQQLDWTVVVMRPTWKIEEQARRARTTTLFAIVAALVLGLVFAYLLSSWLALPISKLARYTQRVAGGESVYPPSPARWDAREVTDLVGTVGSMVEKLQLQADELREHEKAQVVLARFRQELEIAERIQVGILPKCFKLGGFEMAALMKPAEAVGGDYYELIPTEAGFWIAAGDVSGHGLTAGLVMLMLQSALGALAASLPGAHPAEILKATNRLLVENVRHRMGGDDHATLVLMHVFSDGRFVFSGGHEPMLVLRAASGTCDVIETPGPWVGISTEIERHLLERTGQLDPGDLLVLYTDGVTEAGATRHSPYGLERLQAAVERWRDQPLSVLCSKVLSEARNWSPGLQEDDMTIVAIRRRP
jgi:sigma-B regulation protein RsbU (phosphoserine phosphatase)